MKNWIVMRRIFALLVFSAGAAFAQTPAVSAVVNAASYGPQLCPGLIATVYGSNFGTNAASVSVSVGGKAGSVISPVAATQFNVVLPFEASTGTTTLTVTVGSAQSAPFNITLVAFSPYFLTQNSSGSGLASVYENSSNAVVTLTAPAHDGDNLYVYAVGLGPTHPASPPTATWPTVTVGGVSAKVAFAGFAQGFLPEIYQVNFVVPANVQGTQP